SSAVRDEGPGGGPGTSGRYCTAVLPDRPHRAVIQDNGRDPAPFIAPNPACSEAAAANGARTGARHRTHSWRLRKSLPQWDSDFFANESGVPYGQDNRNRPWHDKLVHG